MSRPRRLRRACLRATLPVALMLATLALLLVLHLNGTLRNFLDRQSMAGMIGVVLVLNALGFSFVYMLSATWKAVKRELWPDEDVF